MLKACYNPIYGTIYLQRIHKTRLELHPVNLVQLINSLGRELSILLSFIIIIGIYSLFILLSPSEKEFPLPLSAWERVYYVIVAIPGPLILLFCLLIIRNEKLVYPYSSHL